MMNADYTGKRLRNNKIINGEGFGLNANITYRNQKESIPWE